MGRRWTFAGSALLVAVGALGLAACGDDEEPEVITQEQWDEEAARLCRQHGPTLDAAYVERVPDSDAEEAAFYRADVVPRGRALVRGLDALGYPPDKEAAYKESLNEALAVLQQLNDEPFRYIDQRHQRSLPPEDDLLNRLQGAFAAADIPC